MNKLTEKSKFVGLVIRRILQAEIDGEALPATDFVPHLNDFWSQFTVAYHHTFMPGQPGSGKVEKVKDLWPVVLPKLYAYDPNWECKDITTERECVREQASRLVANLMYNTDSTDDSWLDLDKLKENFEKMKGQQN